MHIKEVIVFTSGDSSKISTWSNVPFLFTAALLHKGIKVNRVDLSPDPFLKRSFDRTVLRIVKKRYPRSSYDYYRSQLHYMNLRRRIKKAINEFHNADTHIFLAFGFPSLGLSGKTAVQFGDWTYEHYIRHFLNREPDPLENRCIEREDRQINGANIVFPLFPRVAEHMKQRYANKNIHYIGNVINALSKPVKEEILQSKKDSYDILFAGNTKYIEGASALLKAFTRLKENFPRLKLHIIGMQESDLGTLPEGVACYGYLDKGKEDERETYYRLFKESKVFINTTPRWAGFSATAEAMYFYLPVLISPYDEFTATFGETINFGYYCRENSPVVIEEAVIKIFNHDAYELLCVNAHNAVKEFTWNVYMDKLINKTEALNEPN